MSIVKCKRCGKTVAVYGRVENKSDYVCGRCVKKSIEGAVLTGLGGETWKLNFGLN